VILRFMGATGVSLLVTLSLFLLMYYIIRPSDIGDLIKAERVSIDFARIQQDEPIRTKERRPPKEPPPSEQPPPPLKFQVAKQSKPVTQTFNMDIPNLDLRMNLGGGPYIAAMGQQSPRVAQQGEVIPVVQVPPQYPRRALLSNIEGFVTMEFTIKPDGSVTDIDVVAAKPPGIFNAAAVTALRRWKFKPKIVDGQAVEQRALQSINFTLAQD